MCYMSTRMGHFIGHCIMAKSGLAITVDNDRMLEERKKFKILFDAEWCYVVNAAARKRRHFIDLNSPVVIPQSEDLVNLTLYLTLPN